jgi:hypothetical protein
VVLIGLSTGTKCEKLNFYSINILNSPLVPVLDPKSKTFSPLVPVQRPQEIDEKNSKKDFFLDICTGPNTLFLDLKIFLKNFGASFGTWYSLRKKRKKKLR